jgi:hypothetical protein
VQPSQRLHYAAVESTDACAIIIMVPALQMVEADIGFVGEVTRVDPSILKVGSTTKHVFNHLLAVSVVLAPLEELQGKSLLL